MGKTAMKEREAKKPVRHDDFFELDILAVRPSPRNPRNFGRMEEKKALGELAQSVKEKGILEPLIVRPVPTAVGDPTAYEIVSGHRRLAAAEACELVSVPCRVMDVDEEEADLIRNIENLHQHPMHPMQEAMGFEVLAKNHVPAAQIAKQVGKTVNFVRDRLALLNLVPGIRKAFENDELGLAVAVELAKLPSKELQVDAYKTIREECDDEDAIGAIREKFRLSLSGAPWAKDDAILVQKAGPCTTCPNRSENQAEMFDDIKAKDICLNRRCFEDKLRAWQKREMDAAASNGVKVLDPKAGERLRHGSEWKDLNEQDYNLKGNTTWRKALGADLEKCDRAMFLEKGNYRHDLDELKVYVKRAQAEKILRSKGLLSRSSSSDSGMPKAEKKRQAEERKRAQVSKEVFAEVLKKLGVRAQEIYLEGIQATLPARQLQEAFFDSVIAGCDWNTSEDVVKACGIEVKKPKYGGADYQGALEKHAKGLKIHQKFALAIQVRASYDFDGQEIGDEGAALAKCSRINPSAMFKAKLAEAAKKAEKKPVQKPMSRKELSKKIKTFKAEVKAKKRSK